MDYRHWHKVVVKKMIKHEREKGHKVEEIIEESSGRTLYFRVDERGVRVFCSSHTGGIMAEDGVAIPEKVYEMLFNESNPFIRIVAIQERKFKDFPLNEFNWKLRNKVKHMRASLSTEQKKKILYFGEDIF